MNPHEQFAAEVSRLEASQAQSVEQQRVNAFDAEMRATGVQRSDTPPRDAVDATLIARLNSWRAEKGSKITPEEMSEYEKGLASAFAGRRNSESMADFEKRTAAKPVTDAPVAADNGPVYIAPSQLSEADRSGYDLSAIPEGMQIDAAESAHLLRAAKASGFTQDQINRFIAAQLADIK